jgi:hypothetical protein
VIFGLAAGAEIYGLPGALVALPVLAVLRAIWEFFSGRIQLEPWTGGGPVPVDVELVDEPPRESAAPDHGFASGLPSESQAVQGRRERR